MAKSFSKETANSQRAAVRTGVLIATCLLLGIVASIVWVFFSKPGGSPSNAMPQSTQPVLLSSSTKSVLDHLSSPVEIKYYAVLDPATTPASLQAFAQRVDRVLSAYEAEAQGKAKIKRYTSEADLGPNSASADGIKVFNLEQGSASMLGLAITGNQQKESMPELRPEWEAALEADLTRAIARVTAAQARSASATAPQRIEPLVLEQVKQAIPNLESVSLDEGTRILRDKSFAEFTDAAKQAEVLVKEAQQRLAQAQDSQSEPDREAAMKHLQDLQRDQTEKLKQIAASSQAQIDAFKQLKKP